VDLRYTQQNNTAVGKFTLAVDTGYGDNKKTSFLNMTIWGKSAEALEKSAPKGTKLLVECEALQNNYTDKNGNKVNTVDFRVLNFEFCESKGSQQRNNAQSDPQPAPQNYDGFMNIPQGIDEELPFN
jgi:single-strand DNA-binding protein